MSSRLLIILLTLFATNTFANEYDICGLESIDPSDLNLTLVTDDIDVESDGSVLYELNIPQTYKGLAVENVILRYDLPINYSPYDRSWMLDEKSDEKFIGPVLDIDLKIERDNLNRPYVYIYADISHKIMWFSIQYPDPSPGSCGYVAFKKVQEYNKAVK